MFIYLCLRVFVYACVCTSASNLLQLSVRLCANLSLLTFVHDVSPAEIFYQKDTKGILSLSYTVGWCCGGDVVTELPVSLVNWWISSLIDCALRMRIRAVLYCVVLCCTVLCCVLSELCSFLCACPSWGSASLWVELWKWLPPAQIVRKPKC